MSMAIIRKMRRQKAVYWKASALDHYGRPTWEAPVEIDCRWQDQFVNIQTPQGESQSFNSVVFVDREMMVGDRLKKGAMDTNVATDPTTDADSLLIQRFENIPDLKAKHFVLKAYL